jgi:Spy/CpxP family protein refolding chaperone
MREDHMSESDPILSTSAPTPSAPAPSTQTPAAPAAAGFRRTGVYAAIAIGAVVVVGAFASSSLSQTLRHHLVGVSDATAVSFDGRFGPFSGLDWQSGVMNGVIEAVIDAHADRMIRHLAVEIDATTEQQDKLRTIVHAAVKDLLPVREKVLAARASARDLLTQQTIDRAAIEKLRADQIAIHDAASRRLVQAVADAAEALTPEQRRKVSEMLPARGFGGWGRGPWGGGFWRN